MSSKKELIHNMTNGQIDLLSLAEKVPSHLIVDVTITPPTLLDYLHETTSPEQTKQIIEIDANSLKNVNGKKQIAKNNQLPKRGLRASRINGWSVTAGY